MDRSFYLASTLDCVLASNRYLMPIIQRLYSREHPTFTIMQRRTARFCDFEFNDQFDPTNPQNNCFGVQILVLLPI